MNLAEQCRDALDLLTPLLLSVALGGALGLERERRDKPAGLRTHMMVALGSTTFVSLAFRMANVGQGEDMLVDPSRILQGVVGGIGFLGAGSIIQNKSNVRGITTAAGLWLCGAIGAACGTGAYGLAVVVTVITLVVMIVIGRLTFNASNGTRAPQGDQ